MSDEFHPSDRVVYITKVVDGESKTYNETVFDDLRVAEDYLFDYLIGHHPDMHLDENNWILGCSQRETGTIFLDGDGEEVASIKPTQIWEDGSECVECGKGLKAVSGKICKRCTGDAPWMSTD